VARHVVRAAASDPAVFLDQGEPDPSLEPADL
jgi:hypothetical protein